MLRTIRSWIDRKYGAITNPVNGLANPVFNNSNRIARILYRSNAYRRLSWHMVRSGVPPREIIRSQFPYIDRDPLRPVFLEVEFTNYCNLQCVYCTSPLGRRPRGYIEPETFANVVTGIEELGIHRVTVVGNGEPTLHPEFGQFIGRLGNVASYVSVLTNAQWHNADEIIAAILQARVRTIEISLDGTDKESYERARVGGNFERLISNLTLLKKLKARTHRRVLTNIRLMLRPSERPLEQSMKKYWRQFADTVMAQYLQERKALRLQKDLYKPAHHLSQEFPRCSQPSNVLGVNWNGNVPLCNFSVEQAGPPGLILGNIKNESLKNIWNGRVMRSYRRGHCDRIPDLMPICKGCTGN